MKFLVLLGKALTAVSFSLRAADQVARDARRRVEEARVREFIRRNTKEKS